VLLKIKLLVQLGLVPIFMLAPEWLMCMMLLIMFVVAPPPGVELSPGAFLDN
jgi:hypothetical protein